MAGLAAAILPGCSFLSPVYTVGHHDFQDTAWQPAFSADSRRVAFAVVPVASGQTRWCLGGRGLLSGCTGRPSILLWETERQRLVICWSELGQPEKVHEVPLPEVPPDAQEPRCRRVRRLAFSPDGTHVAALEARRLSVVRLSDGDYWTWRGERLADFAWFGPDRLAVVACEPDPNGSAVSLLAVTHHVVLRDGRLRGTRVWEHRVEVVQTGRLGLDACELKAFWSDVPGKPERFDRRYREDRDLTHPLLTSSGFDANRVILLRGSAPSPTEQYARYPHWCWSPDGRWLCATGDYDGDRGTVLLVGPSREP